MRRRRLYLILHAWNPSPLCITGSGHCYDVTDPTSVNPELGGEHGLDQSLVDPDNRRPIDFVARTDALVQATPLPELLSGWRDGRVKQAVIALLLQLRWRRPDLFARGRYQKLTLQGPRASHSIAFVRELDSLQLVTMVPRLPYRLLGEGDTLMMPPGTWRETVVCVPGCGLR